MTVASAATVEEAETVVAASAVRSIVLEHSVAAWSVHDSSIPSDARPLVIVVSGLGSDEIDKLRNTYGDRVFAYLAKPIPPHHLIEVVIKAALA